MTVAEKHSFTQKPYVKLQYIESTGTQYIDIGIVPACPSDSMHVVLSKSAGGNGYCGVLDGWGTYDFGVRSGWYAGYFGISELGRAIVETGSYTTYQHIDEWTISSMCRKCVRDGVLAAEDTQAITAQYQYSGPVWLFGVNGSGPSGKTLASARIYLFQLMRDGQPLVDLVPATDADGIVCTYDNVTKRFFYNAGTGDFIAGPEE